MRAITDSKQLCAAMAALVLAVVVAPVAIAGAAGGTKPAPVAKQLKQLKKQIKALQRQTGEQQRQIANLQGQADAPRPASGPAGGDLAGTFPNPLIGPDAVAAAEIQKDAVGAAEIVDDSIRSADIGVDGIEANDINQNAVGGDELLLNSVGPEELTKGAVGANELKEVSAAVSPNGTAIGSGQAGEAHVTCPGETRLIAGGFAWANDGPSSIVHSAPSTALASTTWVVRGYVPSGSNVLYAWATCLKL